MMAHNDEDIFGAPSSIEKIDALARYVRGEVSVREREEIEATMRTSPSVRAAVQILSQSRKPPTESQAQTSLEFRLKQLEEKLQPSVRLPEQKAPSRTILLRHSGEELRHTRSSWQWNWIGAAVGVVFVVVTTLVWLARSPVPVTPPVQHYVTATGERASFTLPDGSQVMLGPESQLNVSPGFGDGKRDVYLEGTAYFSLAPTESAPFTVTAGDAHVRVLGTAFGVRHHHDDSTVTVAVQSGRVAVGVAGKPASMTLVAGANEVARISHTRSNVYPSNAEVARLTSWTRGRIDFENTPLREALPELARWYGVSFRLADITLERITLTGGFQSQRVEDLVETLQYVLPLDVRRSERTIFLSR